jgi:hypothetical protein
MSKLQLFVGLVLLGLIVGCSADIVCTERLAMLETKCVYIAPLASDNPQIGKVLRDVLEKELIRREVGVCGADDATVLISGATFLTVRSTSNDNLLGGSTMSAQAIESVSVIAKDREGEILMSASYDNEQRYSASRLAKEFGSALAIKLR